MPGNNNDNKGISGPDLDAREEKLLKFQLRDGVIREALAVFLAVNANLCDLLHNIQHIRLKLFQYRAILWQ